MARIANSLENHWMPFTANRDFKAEPRLLTRGEGVHYWNHHGERLLDGCSGLFCTAAGHCRPEIADAVAHQLRELDFSPHFQTGHPSSFVLAQRLARLTPGDLNHVFFANSGSEAVDTAIKIVLAYHRARGESERSRFVSRERAYHGVNIGGTALSGIQPNRQAFNAVTLQVSHIRHTWQEAARFTRGQPEMGVDLADDLQRLIDLYGASSIAACFIEPIAGSTGALVPPKGYLERLRAICSRHGILLIFDEVICGFGRTGKAFAAQSFGVTPDIMTMAKALTNGAQPMGAVAVRDGIYETVMAAAPEGSVEFAHGYTYSAHPAACAAALATLDIYERESLFQRAAELTPRFLDIIFALKDIPVVSDIRGYGLLAGIELKPAGRPGQRGLEGTKRLFRAGLHVKFTGDTALIAPPFVATDDDLVEIGGVLKTVLADMAV